MKATEEELERSWSIARKMNLPDHIRDAIFNYIPHMEGWTTPERACEMAAAIIETEPAICVDIGVFAGRSTIAQGFAVRDNQFGIVFGIDAWKVDSAIEGDNVEANAKWWKENADLEKMHRETMQSIWAHHLDEWVTIIRAPSQYVAPQLFARLLPRISFLNVDGCHTEVASVRDIALYVPLLAKGGYLFFDDTDWPSTQKALALIDQSCDLVNDTGKARTYRKR